MKYVECPKVYVKRKNELSLFIAGGISECSDWQKNFAALLKDADIALLNPRREKFSVSDSQINKQQIVWEYTYLKMADATSFWFTEETSCPITLYELGKQLASNKRVFIGIHPNYVRKNDVEIQTSLIRPEIKIVYDLDSLAFQVKSWIKTVK